MPNRLILFIGIFFLSSCAYDKKKVVTENTASKAENKIAISMADTSLVDTTKSNPKDTILLNSAIKQIGSFPEIGKENRDIDSFSQGKHGIAFLIDNPTKDEPYYSIHVGYNGKQRFETYNLFLIYIHKNDFTIRVNDVNNDSTESDDGTISLDEWRKNLKKPEH